MAYWMGWPREMFGVEEPIPRPDPPIRENYSLQLSTSVAMGRVQVKELTSLAHEWRRSVNFFGGPWQGTFRIYGTATELGQWFYSWLGYDIEEKSWGQLAWNGFVWEMDLVDFEDSKWEPRESMRGRRRRVTLEGVYNKVKVVYTNPEDDTTGETAWVEHATSQARYGVKEEILYRELNASQALEAANEFLAASALPRVQFVGIDASVSEPYMEVTVVGYATTGQYRFTQTGDDALSDVGTWVNNIMSTDLQFLTVGGVDPNTRPIYRTVRQYTRAWELLDNLLTLRNTSLDNYRVFVDMQRAVHYKIFSNEPIGYYIKGRFYDLARQPLEDSPRLMPPGIYRDLSLSSPQHQIKGWDDSFFQKPGDFLIESIEVGPDGEIVPRFGIYEEEEALSTFQFDPPEEEGDFE